MKHIVGDPWTYENIEYEIKEIMAELKIDRMPTFTEMNEVTNSGSLTNAINKSGGLATWKINLNLVEKRKKNANIKVTEEVKCKMNKLRLQGNKLQDIANELGLSLNTVYKHVKGVKRDIEEVDKKRIYNSIKKLMFEELTIAEIAEKLGYTIEAIDKEVTKIRVENEDKIPADEKRRREVIKLCEEVACRNKEREKEWAEQLKQEKKWLNERYAFVAK